jgi:hypothetical protein
MLMKMIPVTGWVHQEMNDQVFFDFPLDIIHGMDGY